MMKSRQKSEYRMLNERQMLTLKALFNSSFCLLTSALLCAVYLSLALPVGCFKAGASARPALATLQNVYPEAPSDRALIYLGDAKNSLAALPVESATSKLRLNEVARSDKRGYLELQGEHAATAINDPLPHFYLFVKDVQGVRPPFIVRLALKGKARRVSAMTQKGMSGFAVPSEEIVHPRLLVLKREDGMLFMQVSPREPLAPGEYAFVGADPARIATFRIAGQ
jgi:hypothetical protein